MTKFSEIEQTLFRMQRTFEAMTDIKSDMNGIFAYVQDWVLPRRGNPTQYKWALQEMARLGKEAMLLRGTADELLEDLSKLEALVEKEAEKPQEEQSGGGGRVTP
jgi:hypothetical protein